MPSFPIPTHQAHIDVEREADGVEFTIVSDKSGKGKGVLIPHELLPPVALNLLGGPTTPDEELVDIARQSDPEFLLETARKFLLASLIRVSMDRAVPDPEPDPSAEGCTICDSSPTPAEADLAAKLAEASELVQAQKQRIEQLEEFVHQVAGWVNAVKP